MIELSVVLDRFGWLSEGRVQFVGKYTEILAYGYWCYGFPKQNIKLALDSLKSGKYKIIEFNT